MKPTLVKYFTRHIVGNVFLVWVALACLLVFFEFLREAGNHPLSLAFVYALLKTPFSAMETLPFACVIGATLAMRRLVASGEMAAWRTIGLSPESIILCGSAAAVCFMIFYLLISETLLPAAADLTRSLKNESRLVHGLWLRDDGDFIRVRRVRLDGVMEDIVIYHTDNGILRAVTRAQNAEYADGGWRLHEARTTDVGDGESAVRYVREQAWGLSMQPISFSAFLQKSRDMSIATVIAAINELADVGQQNNELRQTLWRRCLTLPAIFLLVAASIWFINVRRRRFATTAPPLIAVLVGGVYFIFREIAVQSAAAADTLLPLPLPLVLLAAFVAVGARLQRTR